MRLHRFIPLGLFLLLFFSFSYINQGWGWNQNSRLDLMHSIVAYNTIAIDAFEKNTGDKEPLNGHFYSEKAPAITVLAMPAFIVSYEFLSILGIDPNKDGIGWHTSEWMTTAGSVGALAALGGLALYLLLRKRIGETYALVTALAVFLGSLPFPYATMLFSHAGTMGLLAVALWLFTLTEERNRRARSLEYVLGFVCGLAVAGEYPVALAAGVFFILLLLKSWKSALRFVAGSILPMLMVPGYNFLVSGSPFSLGYSHVDFAGMNEGFFGVRLPDPTVIFTILFTQFRGIFFWSPFLLLSFVGYWVMWKKNKRLFWLTLVTPILYILFTSSYVYWDGGFAFGPRHLSAAVPFLGVAAGFGLTALPLTGCILAAVSIILTSLAAFVNAMPPNAFLKPLIDFYPLEIHKGQIASNLGRVIGLPKSVSVLPWLIIVVAAGIWLIRTAMTADGFLAGQKTRPQELRTRLHKEGGPSARQKTVRWTFPEIRLPSFTWKSLKKIDLFRVALWAAILGALILRFVNLSFMEFKSDEFGVMVLAYKQAHGIAPALTGIPSSMGLMNPPFFVWLLSIPALFTGNPVIVTGFVTVLSVAGLAFLYVFLRKLFSVDIALWTTALLATAPWAIIFSRKLWSQDVLLLFLVLLYFSVASLMKERKTWKVYLFFAALAIVTQLHLIAWVPPPLFLLFLDIFRVRIRPRDVLGGMALFVLLYVPYLAFHIADHFQNLWAFLHMTRSPLSFENIFDHLSWAVTVTSGLRFQHVLGDQAYSIFIDQYALLIPLGFMLLYALAVIGACAYSLVIGILNGAKLLRPTMLPTRLRILLLMAAVSMSIILAYVAIAASPYAHYYVILYPFLPLVLVVTLQTAFAKESLAHFFVKTFFLLVVIANLCFSASFIDFIRRSSNVIAGDYGPPYAIKEAEWTQKLVQEYIKR